ncbi:MAG: glycosyltransferase [Pontiella sp.]
MVSVILPVYNCEAYIKECVTSIFSQTEQNIEIIILDDASTDTTLHCVEELRSECPAGISLRIIRNETNCGVSASRSRGLKAAKGKYLYFIDGDDCITPDCFARLRKTSEQHCAEVCCGTHAEFHGTIHIENSKPQTAPPEFFSSNEEIMTAYCSRKFPVFIWNKLILRSFFLETDLHFEDLITNDEDQLWNFRLALRATTWVSCGAVTYYYRQDNPHSITSLSVRDRRLGNYFTVLDCMWAEVKSHDAGSTRQKKLIAQAILNFTKQILWHLELEPDANIRDRYAEFRRHNIMKSGNWVGRYLGFKYKCLSRGWALPYPASRIFNPCYLMNKKKERSH